MRPEPYLVRLMARLSAGLNTLDPDRRRVHCEYLLSHQMPDGGFRGREGGSDLYYTSFAVRGLAVLNEFTAERAAAGGEYIQACARRSLTVVDLVSWLYTALAVESAVGRPLFPDAPPDWPEQIATRLETTRTPDGGYARSEEGSSGSTYHTFLVALTYELLGRPLPDSDAVVRFIRSRQRDDGGFVEIGPMRRGGTNPTAAAVALLQMLGGLDDTIRDGVREFLIEVRGGEGGFLANTRIPFADGLSTFTGLLTAQDLGWHDILEPTAVMRFLASLELPSGGFRGVALDPRGDVEYTFYGLGILGLLGS